MPFLVCIGPNSGHLQQRPNPFIVTTSLSSNTFKTYTFAFSKFQEFCHSFGISTTPTLHSVINFKAWMSLKSYKPSTVVAYIAGISYYLNLNDLSDVNEVFIVRKARMFLLVDLRGKNIGFRVGGRKKMNKKALKMTSKLVIFRAFFSFSELFFGAFFFLFFNISRKKTVKLIR